MSYAEIVEAQAKRDAKEAAVQERKRCAKRKRSLTAPAKAKRTRKARRRLLETRLKLWDSGVTALCLVYSIELRIAYHSLTQCSCLERVTHR